MERTYAVALDLLNRWTEKRLKRLHYNMLKRCYNSAAPAYRYYGAIGITVSDELKNLADFMNFMKTLPGYDDPDLSLDRIDPYGPYAIGNLRFTTQQVQMDNRRGEYKKPEYETGQLVNGWAIQGKEKLSKDGLKLLCKCGVCGNTQWQLRGKLFKNKPKNCIDCFNRKQHDDAVARRTQRVAQ